MKNKLRVILQLLIALSLVTKIGSAKLLEENAWNTFEGKLGNTQIQLSLYLLYDGKIKGNYVCMDSINKIILNGYLKENEIILYEDNSLKIFKGSIVDDFKGVWTDSSTNQSQKFFLKLSSICWGEFEHPYTDMFGTTDEIEGFMQKVKTAVLKDDKEWLASHIQYPQSPSLKNKQQFIKYYNNFITGELKDKIKHTYTTNLFNKNGHAMLADGEIWIGNTSNSTESKYDFIIISI